MLGSASWPSFPTGTDYQHNGADNHCAARNYDNYCVADYRDDDHPAAADDSRPADDDHCHNGAVVRYTGGEVQPIIRVPGAMAEAFGRTNIGSGVGVERDGGGRSPRRR